MELLTTQQVHHEIQYPEAMSRLCTLHNLVRKSVQTRSRNKDQLTSRLFFPSFTEYILDCLLCDRHCGHRGDNGEQIVLMESQCLSGGQGWGRQSLNRQVNRFISGESCGSTECSERCSEGHDPVAGGQESLSAT